MTARFITYNNQTALYTEKKRRESLFSWYKFQKLIKALDLSIP